ncbi:MAG TPA: crossover junction endodeoxyribonuclease RuvC [Terriglobia bacterium]|nr:crossover junction endodeoxyribonuclease RuvC [Terriglobia bacterium]
MSPANKAGKPTAMRILGIDPGLNITGYGVIDAVGGVSTLCEAGVIRLPPSKARDLAERLGLLFDEVSLLVREFSPCLLCLEEVYSHALYPRTAILMGHARGVICVAARQAGIPVLSYSAKRIKQSVTGNGNASKIQVQRAVRQVFSLERTPHPPDVADALAAALCYVNGLKDGMNHDQTSALRPGRRSGRISLAQLNQILLRRNA